MEPTYHPETDSLAFLLGLCFFFFFNIHKLNAAGFPRCHCTGTCLPRSRGSAPCPGGLPPPLVVFLVSRLSPQGPTLPPQLHRLPSACVSVPRLHAFLLLAVRSSSAGSVLRSPCGTGRVFCSLEDVHNSLLLHGSGDRNYIVMLPVGSAW